MRGAAMTTAPSNGAFHYQLPHYQQQQFQRSAPGASPVSQVSVAELAKIFGSRQRSASLQRQPTQPAFQQQQQQQQQYPTMDKRTNPAQVMQQQRQQQQHYSVQQQREACGPAVLQSPGRRGGQPTPVYADPRPGQQQQQPGRSGSCSSNGGRWRSQESLTESSPQLPSMLPVGCGGPGAGGLMFRSVQAEPAPPRLLPSGVPPVSQSAAGACAMPQSQSANIGSLILRPTAFRPVRIGNGAGAGGNSHRQRHPPVTPPSGDSGFVDVSSSGRRSQEPLRLALAAANGEEDCYDNGDDRDDDRSSAGAATSPSDSGLLLADYESLLREKDNELTVLRRTMEQNESALVRVFEERQGELESRLRNEMALNARLTPAVSLGNRRLRQSEQAINDLRLQAQQQLEELQSLKCRLRSAETELRDRTSRVQQLEASLASSRESLDAATWELRRLRAVGDGPNESATATTDRGCQTEVDNDAAAEQRRELAELQARLREQKLEFDRERSQWLEEKSQVLNYQKQLQMNYLQLTKRSQRLEAEAQQLSVDLEAKELHILRLSNGCQSADSPTGTLQSRHGSQC